MQFTELAIFCLVGQARETGNQTCPLFKLYYCNLSPDNLSPRGFSGTDRVLTVIILTTAASSYVTACGSLILLPPRQLSCIVHMCL